jgi:hypothetical protein
MTISRKRRDPLFPFIVLTGSATVGVAALAWQARALRIQVESLAAENRRSWAQLPMLPRIHVPDDQSPILRVPPTTPLFEIPMEAIVMEVSGFSSNTEAQQEIREQFAPAFESCARKQRIEGGFDFMAKISQTPEGSPVGRPTAVMSAPGPALACVSEAASQMKFPYGTAPMEIELELRRIPANGPPGPRGPSADASTPSSQQMGPDGPTGP